MVIKCSISLRNDNCCINRGQHSTVRRWAPQWHFSFIHILYCQHWILGLTSHNQTEKSEATKTHTSSSIIIWVGWLRRYYTVVYKEAYLMECIGMKKQLFSRFRPRCTTSYSFLLSSITRWFQLAEDWGSLCTIKWDKPESETLDFRSLPTEWWRLSLWLHGTTNCSVAEMSRPFHLWGWMSIWSDRFLCLLFLLSDWLGANGRTHQAHQLLWPKLLHRCDNHLFQPFILECGKTLTIILWSQLCGWCSFSLQPNPMLCFSLKLIWIPPLPLCSF